MLPSLILRAVSRWILPTVVTFSVFLLASGHNRPGGGFVGGLVAGAALVIAYAADGPRRLSEVLPVSPPGLLGAGLLVAVTAAAAPWLVGGSILESASAEVELPVFGAVKIVSVLAFDAGVWLIVVGLVAELLVTLGAREPEDVEA